MLVEDDNNLREIYEARLLAEGYEIVSAEDGEQALAMAVKEKPDLIISDVMMPKISGFDMLDILRSTPETRDTKVIMMTALSQVEDKARADKLGADRYLVKSQVTLEDVAKVAKEVLSGESPQPTPAVTPTVAPVVAEPVTVQPVVEPPAAVEPVATESATVTQPTTATPDEPAAAPVAVTPTVPEPSAAAASVIADDTAVVDATAQTADAEEQTVESQIEQFVSNLPEQPPAAVEPVAAAEPAEVETAPTPPANEAAAAPETEPQTPVVDATNAAAQDAANMADAANELLQTTDGTASTAASSSQLPSKRIIQPITDVSTESKPDLNELLALEEAKEQALAAATNTAPEPEASSEPVATAIEAPAATEPAATSPEPIVETPVAPAPATPETPPPAAPSDSPDDPNNIAL